MSNSRAQNELNERLKYHFNLFWYARQRNLSFCEFHYQKFLACLEAVGTFNLCFSSGV